MTRAYLTPLLVAFQACGASQPTDAREELQAAASPHEPAAPAGSTGEVAAVTTSRLPVDEAWATVEARSFGEIDARQSEFFVDEAGERVLRVDRNRGGWWSLDNARLTPIDGLHGSRIAGPVRAASANLAVYGHFAYDDAGDRLRPMVEVWDTNEGDLRRHRLRDAEEPKYFASGLRVIATIDEQGTVRVYDGQGERSGPRLSRVRVPCAFAMSSDAETFAAWSCARGVAQVSRRGRVVDVPPPETPEGTDYFSMAISDDGRSVAFATWGVVRVVDVETRRVRLEQTFTDDHAAIDAVAFGPGGELFVSNVSTHRVAILNGPRTLVRRHAGGRIRTVRWTERGLFAFGRNTLIRWRDGQEDEDLTLVRSVPHGHWRPLEAPRVEVIGAFARVIFDVSTGRAVEGAIPDGFEVHRITRQVHGVAADEADFAATAAEDAFLIDRSSDGSRRVVTPSGRPSRLVPGSTMDLIARVNGNRAERMFSADGSWFATASSYREGERDLQIRRSEDGEILASVRIPVDDRERIDATTVLPSDDIVVRGKAGVHVYRWSDGEVTRTAQREAASTGWFVRSTELLLAVPQEEDCVVQRLRLPDLALLGETRLENVSEPVLGYLPDGRRFGAVAQGRLHIATLPGAME